MLKKKIKLLFISFAVTMLLFSVFSASAQAAMIMYTLDSAFYSDDPMSYPPKPDPQGSSLAATFDDEGTPGSVRLTLTADLMYSHNAKDWFFNFDPSLDIEDLTFTPLGGTAPNDSVSLGTDAFNADSGGRYDIKILFPDIEVMPGGDVFNDGEYFEFLITHPEPIDAWSFKYESTPHGEYGIWYAAGHIQNLNDEFGAPDPEYSTWVGAVPIPSAVWLLGFGLIAFVGVRRKL